MHTALFSLLSPVTDIIWLQIDVQAPQDAKIVGENAVAISVFSDFIFVIFVIRLLSVIVEPNYI